MRFLIFISIFIIVFALMSIYISKRFIKKLHFKKVYKNYLNYFLIINLIGVFCYFLFRRYPLIPNEIYFLLSIPIGIIFLLFSTTIIYDLTSLVVNKTVKDNSRRDFLKKTLDFSAVAIAAGINSKAIYNAKHAQLEKVNIKLNKLKQKYNIVQISDIHIGGLIDKEFISSMVEKINSLNTDAIVITGDLVDTNLKFAKPALEELKHLNSKYGTYFIVGNHEYFHGVDKIISYVKTLNITVLENSNTYIGNKNNGFNLAGVYDRFGERFGSYKPDIKASLKNIDITSPTVLLAHQPKYIEEIDTTNIDLILSGHTHGGQIVPFNLLVKLQQPYIKGLHQHNKNTQIYVNKGTGFWGPPMRLGSSAEITYINLLPY
ncbi:metallophosphoesterase [Malaciobacter molluscorum LMG 25693]|uniref:Metallophosphoesterase n=1 Tax=Malaciobacter molluscorum LMG 25693 TaxID=870501 RepID=A0A2G1DHD6_9BACT|nr:metallophosphoesterase [Malaciobacter molluscorum]AXX93687.1 membrane-associated metallophosphoesterase (YkuE domain) [Malaciobacter molluscorum LMG 25693]PHO17903.1 metallophosphoesterase [Malaciobacter molluscorum LMG 25693]